MTMTNEQLEEAVARLTTKNFVAVVRGKDIDDMQSIIRQLWAEREKQRAVMAQAKPVEAGELAEFLRSNSRCLYPYDSAQAILSRYNVTKKEEV